jgi:hypothetical protein
MEIPCSGVKVDRRELAETALATAFIDLDRRGYCRLYLGTRPGPLGISRKETVCLEPPQSSISATGLEGWILDTLGAGKTRNNAFSIARRMRVAPTASPSPGAIIAKIGRDLLEQGYFQGRGKLAQAFVGQKLVPDCQRIAALQREVEPVMDMLKAFERDAPEVYRQLFWDIHKATT